MSRYISASLNYLLATPLLATLRDKIESGVKAIFSCQSSEFADYSKQCQLQHCPDTANAGGVLAKETINAMASIQCTPDAKFDQITKKLLDDKGQATKYPTDVPDELWELMVPFLVPLVRTKSGGSPQTSIRSMINGIFYHTKTGCQWALLPREFGSKTAVHEFYQKLNRMDVLAKIQALVCLYYEATNSYDFVWQSADGTLVQAPARAKMDGEEGFGRNPTDRGRKGTKLHVRCDAFGVPIAIEIEGANVHDSEVLHKNFENTIAPFENLESPLDGDPHNMCLDAAYVGEKTEEYLAEQVVFAHIRPRHEENAEKDKFPPRRWVVERLMAWLKGHRGIRTRYTCYLRNFIGDVRIATIRIIWGKIAKMI